jgi:hypothetical protein
VTSAKVSAPAHALLDSTRTVDIAKSDASKKMIVQNSNIRPEQPARTGERSGDGRSLPRSEYATTTHHRASASPPGEAAGPIR